MSYDIAIIGGGPAGLTAGLYCARSGLKSILVERGAFGGQILNTRFIENYPGFPEGISGAELGEFMYRQAIKYNLETQVTETLQLDKGENYKISTSEGDIQAKSVIIAAGSKYRKLNIPGEKRLSGYGVSYCATCDGFFFRDRIVAVVGGGDTAITDALELAQHVKRVYVIHRRSQLRAGKILQQQAFNHPKLEFIWDTIAEEVIGENKVEELALSNVKTGQKSKLKIDGVFVAIGLIPNSQAFLNILELDKDSYIITDENMATSAPGVFAAGDIRRHSPRQIATAVGDGVAAAMSAFRYIQQQNN
jgi:thioredoxin reductase (NADPH)